jgi:hypothetical protein
MSKEDDDKLSRKQQEAGIRWFHGYVERIENQPEGLPMRCPCCLCRTLDERGGYDICPVCSWEDDGQDDYDADAVRGGPNGALSLTQARKNFLDFGACDKKSIKHVRKPLPQELPGTA